MNALEYTKKLTSFESTSVFSNAPVTDCVEETLGELGFAPKRLEYEDERDTELYAQAIRKWRC